MNHHGYIYQACNFIYTGATKKRTDIFTEPGKHSRHYSKECDNSVRKIRSAKHRYVYFCTNSRKMLKEWKENFRWKEFPYPKGDNNDDYTLGEYLKDEYVSTNV